MSTAAAPTEPTSPANPAGPGASPAEIDASCSAPVLTLFVCAAGWLIAGSVFALIASLKFHAPGLLADSAWLTYGRVYPASTNAMTYGFGIQAGLGVLLALFSRLGRTKLALPGLAWSAAVFWNFGVAIGLGGILAGNSTGFEWLEMPRCASSVLFCAYTLAGISGATTFYRRRVKGLYASQWYLLAALFWFPWIYSTANLLLVYAPVRGVAQAAVHWWFINNLNGIWFGFVGLAAIFYVVAKLTARPLHSHYLAMFAFWTLALFGSWGGVPSGTPLPAWMPSVSTVCTVLTLVPVSAVAVNCHQTLRGQYSKLRAASPLGFIAFGIVAYLAAGLAAAAVSFPEVAAFTQFTWFSAAQARMGVYGFFGMTMFGAIYYLLPRLAKADIPSPTLVRVHFWCAGAGTALFVLPLAIGGVLAGRALDDANVAFTDASKVALPFLRCSTTGELLMAVGHGTLAVNLCRLLARRWRARWEPVLKSWIVQQPAGAEALR